jgi:hypothetical protein
MPKIKHFKSQKFQKFQKVSTVYFNSPLIRFRIPRVVLRAVGAVGAVVLLTGPGRRGPASQRGGRQLRQLRQRGGRRGEFGNELVGN